VSPGLTITTPAGGDTLVQGSTLTGTVTPSGNAAIVCLCYTFDSSTTKMAIPFNADGTFSKPQADDTRRQPTRP
jgi:hypothetical protein